VSAADTDIWEEVRDSLSYTSGRWPSREVLDACRFRHESPYIRVKQAFDDYGEECFEPGQPVLACAEALMQKIHRELKYSPGETNIATPLADVLENRRGVCQDFAHLMIACLRSRGLAARYVSGYIRLRPAMASADCGEGDPAKLAVMPAQLDWVGAGASHAWVAVYSPPFGWLELDPTNNVHVGTDHIGIAWGRDFGDVSPLRGVILGGGSHDLSVSVTVEPL
jgi:transglutaminase-like putative cysteine protease